MGFCCSGVQNSREDHLNDKGFKVATVSQGSAWLLQQNITMAAECRGMVGRKEEEEEEQKEEREEEEEGEDDKRKEAERGREGISLQKHISSDLLPPGRLHLLKFPKPLKTAAPPSVQYMSPMETFHI